MRLRLTQTPAHDAVRGFRRHFRAARARGRRILRGHSARHRGRRCAPGSAASLRRNDLEQAVFLSGYAANGCRAILCKYRSAPPSARRAAITSGRTSTTPTSFRCRTSGNTPGMPPGIWHSTRCPSLSSTPRFAKQQLLLLTREWYMHPNGQMPAYEWAFGDVNPPVHAWATWRVFQMDRKHRGDAGDLGIPRTGVS